MKLHHNLHNAFIDVISLFLFSFFLSTGLQAQPQLPARFLKYQPDTVDIKNLARLKSQAYNIAAGLPANYSKNGTVDYTNVIQAALDKHSIVLMPNFPVLINDSGLTVRSNQTIIFNTRSKLILKPSSKDTYEMIRIHNVENVKVYYPVVYGDKLTHLNTIGQWGMGIAVRASKNVTLVRPQIFDCWGDGIYIGEVSRQASENVNITKPVLNGNRRNGLSITSAKNVTISGGIIANSGPQMPMSGIDIEPNHNYNVIDNIVIDSVVTFGHPKYGIVVSLQHLLGRSAESTNIEIKNHRDEGSNIGLGIIGKPAADTLSGDISVIKPVWVKNKEAGIRLPLRNYGMSVTIQAPVILQSAKANELQTLREYLRKMPGSR